MRLFRAGVFCMGRIFIVVPNSLADIGLIQIFPFVSVLVRCDFRLFFYFM